MFQVKFQVAFRVTGPVSFAYTIIDRSKSTEQKPYESGAKKKIIALIIKKKKNHRLYRTGTNKTL